MTERNLSGWRPSPPDFRDHVYAAPRRLLASLPATVDLSRGLGGPWATIWDQYALGACGQHVRFA